MPIFDTKLLINGGNKVIFFVCQLKTILLLIILIECTLAYHIPNINLFFMFSMIECQLRN